MEADSVAAEPNTVGTDRERPDADSTLLDMGAVDRLDELGGVDFVCSMIDLFFSTTDERMEKAKQAMASGDLEGVETATHGMVASAGFIGATEMEALADRVPDAVATGSVEQTKALLERIEQNYKRLLPLLHRTKQQRLLAEAGQRQAQPQR